jgi:hypothetical protein
MRYKVKAAINLLRQFGLRVRSAWAESACGALLRQFRMIKPFARAESACGTLDVQERKDIMDLMRSFMDSQDEPKVGIFWYDDEAEELFGITKSEASIQPANSKGNKTVRTLHKNWWKKQEMRDRAKGLTDSAYYTDYTLTPRGRVFQNADGSFRIMCGTWMTDSIKNLIIDEFDLQGQIVNVVQDVHWEIGNGWDEEL